LIEKLFYPSFNIQDLTFKIQTKASHLWLAKLMGLYLAAPKMARQLPNTGLAWLAKGGKKPLRK